ncbi:YrvL family regulatory protein [Solibacillus sp. FSL R7-0668]|uniref:YrvL family regulatory protein n=1 Tax=Solibacillus sp. FSL R7-0668 TaxID=2921688 RepID=UPI0030FA5DA0
MEASQIKNLKIIVICTSILGIALLGFAIFEYIFLKIFGLQYNSIGALLLFFVLYVFLEMPLSLIANALPKALKSLDIIQSSKGWLSIILNTCLTFGLIKVIDTFMDTISITWQGALLFALITALINWKLGEQDDEPPMRDSEEFKQIEQRLSSKK